MYIKLWSIEPIKKGGQYFKHIGLYSTFKGEFHK